jgi:competence protein ComEC
VLRFTSIDVGQGDALLLQFPTGDALLVDAGGTTGAFDVGGRVVAPALWASGVRRLDWLAATHPDIDHIGGTVRVARLFHPGEIWEGIAVGTAEARMELRRIAADAGMAWRTLRNGDRLDIGAVSVEVLHPAPPDWERRAARNDDSLVLRVRYHDVELLLTGDIGAAVEREIDVAAGSPLRVLKVAHHGSRTSTSAAFVERYRPDVAIVSAGSGNSFGHPVPEVVNRLRESGARLFRTDQDGAIIVETDGAEVRVRTISGRAWSVRVWPIRP